MSSTVDKWPRKRLQIRSALSATLPIGWIWVAATALVPYYLIGRGPGTGAVQILGLSRPMWMAMHVWSSILMGMVTLGHAVLNRRGLVRSYRLVGVGGRPRSRTALRSVSRWEWIPAAALIVVTLAGSWVFAAASGERAGANQATYEQSQTEQPAAAQGNGTGHQHRGGRGGG
jgi:hypothetical protein